MISYGKQSIDKNDIKMVTKTLKNNFLTQGPNILKFEKKLEKYFSCKHACAVSSGTAALHLVSLSLDLKKTDIVLASPIGFLATTNSVIYAGANVDFVDIENKTFNLDPNKLEDKIIKLKKKNKKIKAAYVTDYAGHPADWKSLNFLSKKYTFFLINDNCHSLGAKYNKSKDYALKYADVVTLSFHPVKIITTGEGGAVLTNNQHIYNKINVFRNHGIFRNKKKQNNKGLWFYEMKNLGFNYRLTDFQCSLGISQIKKIDKFVKRRQEIAKRYDNHFRINKNLTLPIVEKNVSHAYHLYPLQINFKRCKISKINFFKEFYKKGIKLQVHYIPIHLQPYYKKKFKFKKGDFPLSEKFYEKEVSLPVYYDLKNNQIDKISRMVNFYTIK